MSALSVREGVGPRSRSRVRRRLRETDPCFAPPPRHPPVEPAVPVDHEEHPAVHGLQRLSDGCRQPEQGRNPRVHATGDDQRQRQIPVVVLVEHLLVDREHGVEPGSRRTLQQRTVQQPVSSGVKSVGELKDPLKPNARFQREAVVEQHLQADFRRSTNSPAASRSTAATRSGATFG